MSLLKSLFAISILFFSIKMSACSCSVPAKETEQEKISRNYNRTDLVFSGNVIKIEDPNPGTVRSSADLIKYTFEIITIYKGEPTSQTIQILSARSGISCGYTFSEGNTYIVYANNKEQKNNVNNYRTGTCYGNTLGRNATKQYIKTLKKLKKRN